MSQHPESLSLDAAKKRSTLPEGTISIGIGLIIAGVAIYAFFKIGQQALGQDGFKPLVSLWFVMFALAPGFFLPVEQEISRAIAHRRELGQGSGPIVKKVILMCLGIVIGLIALIVALAQVVNNNLFDGYGIVTVSLAIALATYGANYLTKGLCSGLGKFTLYGVYRWRRWRDSSRGMHSAPNYGGNSTWRLRTNYCHHANCRSANRGWLGPVTSARRTRGNVG